MPCHQGHPQKHDSHTFKQVRARRPHNPKHTLGAGRQGGATGVHRPCPTLCAGRKGGATTVHRPCPTHPCVPATSGARAMPPPCTGPALPFLVCRRRRPQAAAPPRRHRWGGTATRRAPAPPYLPYLGAAMTPARLHQPASSVVAAPPRQVRAISPPNTDSPSPKEEHHSTRP